MSSIAFLVPSANRLPAEAPFTVLTVIPSIPADTPRAAFDAACSMLDKPVLTLLIGAFALLTSTSTTSSSLLSVARGRLWFGGAVSSEGRFPVAECLLRFSVV